jgi:thiamine kinase-like enzyme
VGELNDILQSLEASLGPLTGEPRPLEGGITNRNYRVTLGGSDYVVRRPGKDTALLGIDRGAERIATDAAAHLGIAPPIVAQVRDCTVTRFVTCRALGAEEVAEAVEELGRALRRFHDSGVSLPVTFSVPDLLDRYAGVVTERGARLPDEYGGARAAVDQISAALPAVHPRPCHNDLLAGNIIRGEEDGALLIVDWEYAGMGDPRFDLGNLAVNNSLDEDAEARLLRAYHGRECGDSERAQLKLTRMLSDAREGAWGVVQTVASALDFDFGGYAEEHFARLELAVQDPAFDAWLTAAAQR